jgi:hypothetical protein
MRLIAQIGPRSAEQFRREIGGLLLIRRVGALRDRFYAGAAPGGKVGIHAREGSPA